MTPITRRTFLGTSAALTALGTLRPRLVAAPTAADLDAVISKGAAALAAKQSADGSFGPQRAGPGVTGIAAAALLRSGRKPDDPTVARALAAMEKCVQPDGGVYVRQLANYTTCIALMTFKDANVGGKYDTVIADAGKFLRSIQKGDDVSESDSKYGGVGYDGKTRPDLSNTHYFVDALVEAGIPKDDPAVKRALAFVSRCQNLKGESNALPYAAKATEDDKGGFVYTPTDAEGKPGKNSTPDGGLRSYGSMTYAGLKSFLYAGVSKDDPRVKAAVDWVRRHYSVTENHGQKDTGLFYYYHLFAKALEMYGEDQFADSQGVKHDWRQDLFAELKKRQAADGTWVNGNPQFLEGTPELATAFALLALSHCRPKA